MLSLGEHFGVEVVRINSQEDAYAEEDLAKDLLEIITVFSARLYGSHSHKRQQLIEELRDVAQKL